MKRVYLLVAVFCLICTPFLLGAGNVDWEGAFRGAQMTKVLGTPGVDTKIPTEKAVRTAITGFAATETLATVTVRGSTTSTVSTFSGGVITPKVYPAADSTTAVQINKADGTTSVINIDTTGSNIGINNQTTTGTSGVGVTTIKAGVAPTTSPTDTAAYWVADRQGVAGKAALHMRDEEGNTGSVAFTKRFTKTVTTTPVTLGANEVCNADIVIGITGTIALPAGSAALDGCSFTVYVKGAYVSTIDPNTTDQINHLGTDNGAGVTLMSDGLAGTKLDLFWDTTASRWVTTNGSGLWVTGT